MVYVKLIFHIMKYKLEYNVTPVTPIAEVATGCYAICCMKYDVGAWHIAG